MVRTVIATNSFWLCKAQRTQRVIHSKSWSTNSADNFEFSAERLSENVWVTKNKNSEFFKKKVKRC